jgi:hypothetical protein
MLVRRREGLFKWCELCSSMEWCLYVVYYTLTINFCGSDLPYLCFGKPGVEGEISVWLLCLRAYLCGRAICVYVCV